MKILIVEDNAANYEEIVGLLNTEDENNLPDEEKAYQFVRAKNKQEALDALKNTTHQFDIALLDIKLNEKDLSNKDGLIISRTITNSPNPIPIIIITQHFDNSQYAREAERYGIPLRYFLSKAAVGDNPYIFQKHIDDAVDNFGIGDTNYQKNHFKKNRKVGIRMPRGEIKFFNSNEILYLKTFEATKTKFVFSNNESAVLTYHLGRFVPKIRSNYPNFIRLDQSILVNIEMIDQLIGETLYFTENQFVRIGKTAIARLRRENLIL
mgnify:CR=1 FL=1